MSLEQEMLSCQEKIDNHILFQKIFMKNIGLLEHLSSIMIIFNLNLVALKWIT